MGTRLRAYGNFEITSLTSGWQIAKGGKSAPFCSRIQWRSYTRAHTGPGPGEFLSALVNHARSTYLNRNSVAVYIELCHVE